MPRCHNVSLPSMRQVLRNVLCFQHGNINGFEATQLANRALAITRLHFAHTTRRSFAFRTDAALWQVTVISVTGGLLYLSSPLDQALASSDFLTDAGTVLGQQRCCPRSPVVCSRSGSSDR